MAFFSAVTLGPGSTKKNVADIWVRFSLVASVIPSTVSCSEWEKTAVPLFDLHIICIILKLWQISSVHASCVLSLLMI